MIKWIDDFQWRDLFFVLGCVLYIFSMATPDHYTPWTAAINDGLGFFSMVSFLVFLLFLRKLVWIEKYSWMIFLVCCIPVIQRVLGLLIYNSDVVLVSDYLWCLSGGVIIGGNFYVLQREGGTRYFDYFLICVYAVGIFLALFGIAQWLGVGGDVFGYFSAPVFFDVRMRSNLLQPNMLATALLMSFGASLYLKSRGLIGNVLFFMGAALLISCVAATFSKAGFVSLALMLLYLYFLYFRDNFLYFKSVNYLHLTVFFVSGIYALIFFCIPYAENALLIRPLTFTMTLDSVGLRGVLYRQMGYALIQSPWLGYGWNNVRMAQKVGALKFPGVEYTLYSHNIFLDIFVWSGVVFGFFIAVMFVFWIARVAFFSKKARKMGLTVVLIPFVFHSLVEYPYAYSGYLLVFGFLMGGMGVECGVNGWLCKRYYLLPVVFFYFLINVVVFRDYDVYRTGYVSNSLRVSGVQEFQRVLPGKMWLLDGEQDVLDAMLVKVTPHMTANDIELLDRASSRFYSGYLIRNSMVADYLNGKKNRACEKMAIYESINPRANTKGMEIVLDSSVPGHAIPLCAREILKKYRDNE